MIKKVDAHHHLWDLKLNKHSWLIDEVEKAYALLAQYKKRVMDLCSSQNGPFDQLINQRLVVSFERAFARVKEAYDKLIPLTCKDAQELRKNSRGQLFDLELRCEEFKIAQETFLRAALTLLPAQ